jgi:hypothetical protein
MSKYFGKYDESGQYVAFYSTDVWDEANIPTDQCIEITHDQWQQALEQRCGVVDGVHTVIDRTEAEVAETQMLYLRNQRDYLLKQSDWTQFNDSPLTAENKAEWALYRQALRDLPQNVNINNVVFPTQPQ